MLVPVDGVNCSVSDFPKQEEGVKLEHTLGRDVRAASAKGLRGRGSYASEMALRDVHGHVTVMLSPTHFNFPLKYV